MFKSYFSDTELQELETITKDLENKLNYINLEIKDIEIVMKRLHFKNDKFCYEDFCLTYRDGRIYYQEDGADERRLLECKKEIRLKIANFLPVFVRDMGRSHKERIKNEIS